jgi:hypothetical protein
VGNACYHSVQNLLPSHLLCENVKIKIYKSIMLPVVSYGCETWALKLREEHRLRVFENRVLRRIFGLKRNESGSEYGPVADSCEHSNEPLGSIMCWEILE